MNSPVTGTDLTKRYAKVTALDSLTFSIPSGRVVGLLGRNGSGKSSLLKIVAGLSVPTEGVCLTLGEDSRRLEDTQLARIGFVHQDGGLPPLFAPQRLFDVAREFNPLWDRARERKIVDLLEVPVRSPIGHLSPGDRQKAAIVLGVCHHPSLLLLDEPVSALDPIIRARMFDLLFSMIREDQCTILVSSHILGDVEKVVDWVMCLDRGHLVANEPWDDLQERFSQEAGRPMGLEGIFPLLVNRLPARP
jgi:ABC-2 type transport system ATP-binding protein